MYLIVNLLHWREWRAGAGEARLYAGDWLAPYYAVYLYDGGRIPLMEAEIR